MNNARYQFVLVCTGSSVENLWSPLCSVTPNHTQQLTQILAKQINNDINHDTKKMFANFDSDLSDGLGNNWTEDEPELRMESESAAMRIMMEVLCKILNKGIEQNTKLYMQNAEMMEVNQDQCR